MTNSNKRSSEEKTSESKKPKSNSQVEPPKTGWEGPVPNKDGGSEEGYLFKPPYAWKSDKFKEDYTASCWCGKGEKRSRLPKLETILADSHLFSLFSPLSLTFSQIAS
jgi:hypothetical protein